MSIIQGQFRKKLLKMNMDNVIVKLLIDICMDML